MACGAERIDLTIERPAMGSFSVKLVEGPGGHYTGIWDWSSTSGTASTSIMVGKHIARFTVAGSLGTWSKELPFFVIFDPAEVSAPQRFTFDHTGVWFGTGNGSLRALSYALHLSDNRVFGWAMDVIGGQTDSWKAAELLIQAEHQKFKYDEGYHGADVLQLLEHHTEAQCADDANMLTALLRASGIPAHIPSKVQVGETFPLQIRLTNRLDRPLTGASVELELPFACTVEKPISIRARENTDLDFQSVPPVEPGATANVEWLLRAVSPSISAAIRINASAPDFGERRISVATSIPDLRPMNYTDPVVSPTYARENDF